MNTSTLRVVGNRDGVAVLFALGLLALLAIGALAIDLGMLFTARAEAQRVADSAALAGASAFKDFIPKGTARLPAIARAYEYATENTIRGVKVDSANVAVEVDTIAYTVTAYVRSPNLGTWMARSFGVTDAVVSTQATARFAPVGGVKCVKPFAIPDLWHETNTAPPSSSGAQEDGNADRRWGNDEGWNFDPGAGDRYQKWSLANATDPLSTGYHSQWRNAIGSAPPFDIGMTLTVKSQRPGTAIASGFFYPWRIGASSGANDYRNDILGCNPATASVGVPYPVENGNMVGPTRQGILGLMSLDSGASWDQPTQSVVGSVAGNNWQNSPRVFIAGLFDPNQIANIQSGGNLDIVFNDFALFFLEGLDATAPGPASQAPVLARFIGFATGSEDGSGAGELSRRLRLIK